MASPIQSAGVNMRTDIEHGTERVTYLMFGQIRRANIFIRYENLQNSWTSIFILYDKELLRNPVVGRNWTFRGHNMYSSPRSIIVSFFRVNVNILTKMMFEHCAKQI